MRHGSRCDTNLQAYSRSERPGEVERSMLFVDWDMVEHSFSRIPLVLLTQDAALASYVAICWDSYYLRTLRGATFLRLEG